MERKDSNINNQRPQQNYYHPPYPTMPMEMPIASSSFYQPYYPEMMFPANYLPAYQNNTNLSSHHYQQYPINMNYSNPAMVPPSMSSIPSMPSMPSMPYSNPNYLHPTYLNGSY
jgi:hypothetical protein